MRLCLLQGRGVPRFRLIVSCCRRCINCQLITLQRYKIENRKSSILGYFFKIFSIMKSIFQNIKTFE